MSDADSADRTLQIYAVFVQWKRGETHQYEESVRSSDEEMALLHAKRNIDVRLDPVSIWVVPEDAIKRTPPNDSTLTPSTDRGYREIEWYAENRIDPDGGDEESDNSSEVARS